MFRRTNDVPDEAQTEIPQRVDSILGANISWQGTLTGSGGIRIEGAFDGDIALDGLVVVGPAGRITCRQVKAQTVVVAGSVKGDILAAKVEILKSGRVWGDVTTVAFSTEEGAFLRGAITMEDELDLGFAPKESPTPPDEPDEDQDEGETSDGGES
ncbi:MAG: polymer-forming cytoskeletal protein [Anaerolineales bacterium]|jgi:cytoskeletal protein CcmA (bactofilin family)